MHSVKLFLNEMTLFFLNSSFSGWKKKGGGWKWSRPRNDPLLSSAYSLFLGCCSLLVLSLLNKTTFFSALVHMREIVSSRLVPHVLMAF